jgi:hypothetical protein
MHCYFWGMRLWDCFFVVVGGCSGWLVCCFYLMILYSLLGYAREIRNGNGNRVVCCLLNRCEFDLPLSCAGVHDRNPF